MRKNTTQRANRRGFSMVELILAIGVFGLTIMAVLAMLGSSSQATADVLNTVNASQIADAVRTELETIGYDALETGTSGGALRLVGTKDGERVALESNTNSPTGDPPGIYGRDRFFLIEVERLGNAGDSLAYVPDGNASPFGAQLALSVRIYWPHQIRTGSGQNAYVVADPTRQSLAIFNVSIPRS